ncbi:hypothetical protein GGS21DRAFT_493747 [Xylaria nigripes]|nr:hypothetical protein GGS21DRAFT_493747 [Xylaria nigripes]
MKDSRFSVYEFEPFNAENSTADRIWNCCQREESEKPQQDWWNVKFTRGDRNAREQGATEPRPVDCPPTYHEPFEGAAGWAGWRHVQNGQITKYSWDTAN